MEPCLYAQPIALSISTKSHADELRRAIGSVIPWYHGSINRNTAEAILLASGCEGSYLLRDCQHKKGDYVLSVRSSDSVKHFEVQLDSGGIHFGVGYFQSVDEFLKHFENTPVLSSETGKQINLLCPYPRHVDEPPMYLDVKSHAICGSNFQIQKAENDFHIASKEGYLTKLGRIHKNWKKRWFVLYKSDLKYFKRRGDHVALRILNLKNAVEVTEDISTQKGFCFRLVFPQRTFYMLAGSTEDMRDWIEAIDWKLDRFKNLGKD